MVRIHQHTKYQVIPSIYSPQNGWKPKIWPVSVSQNCAKIRKINNCDQNLISDQNQASFDWLKVTRIHLYATFQAIPSMRAPENVRKPQIWPVSLKVYGLCDFELRKKTIVLPNKVNVFCKFHEMWVKTPGDIAARNVTGLQTVAIWQCARSPKLAIAPNRSLCTSRDITPYRA